MDEFISFRNGGYVKGDYAIMPCCNAFNKKVSYWISKKGCTKAFYCWSHVSHDDDRRQLDNFDTYIKYFDENMN